VKYLLDTHVLLWAFLETRKLSPKIKSLLLDEYNDVYYSSISLWEISIKYGLKKLSLKGGRPEDFFDEVINSFYICHEVSNSDLITSYNLPVYHKDPFDRLLIWQAIRNDCTLLSADKTMNLYKDEGLKVVF